MSNNSKPQFTPGHTVHVWETKGVRDLKGGISSSERIDGEYPNLEPSENLLVVKRLGSTRAVVQRDIAVDRDPKTKKGREILMHINHITPDAAYYALRGAKAASTKPLSVQIAEAKADLESKQAALAQLEAQAQQADEEAAEDVEMDETALDEARTEAADLFEQAEGQDEGQSDEEQQAANA